MRNLYYLRWGRCPLDLHYIRCPKRPEKTPASTIANGGLPSRVSPSVEDVSSERRETVTRKGAPVKGPLGCRMNKCPAIPERVRDYPRGFFFATRFFLAFFFVFFVFFFWVGASVPTYFRLPSLRTSYQ